MPKLLLPSLIALLFVSCGSKETQNDDTTTDDVEESVKDSYTPYTGTSTSSKSSRSRSSSSRSNIGDSDGYRFGYDMGYIDGNNDNEYNPYLPNSGQYSYAYRQSFCQGYDEGYQVGQQDADRASYYVNTGDNEVIYDDDDYDDGYYYDDY